MPRSKKSAPSLSSSRAVVPVRAIDFVMYHAKDLRKTRAFYQNMFGLKRGDDWDDFWSEFDTAPIAFALNSTSKKIHPEWNWKGEPCVAFAVHDVRAAVEKLRRRRVKILIEPVETSVCWMAWIADPSGNRVCLHHRKDGTAG